MVGSHRRCGLQGNKDRCVGEHGGRRAWREGVVGSHRRCGLQGNKGWCVGERGCPGELGEKGWWGPTGGVGSRGTKVGVLERGGVQESLERRGGGVPQEVWAPGEQRLVCWREGVSRRAWREGVVGSHSRCGLQGNKGWCVGGRGCPGELGEKGWWSPTEGDVSKAITRLSYDLSVSQGSAGEPGDRGDVGRKGSTGPQVMLKSVDVIM